MNGTGTLTERAGGGWTTLNIARWAVVLMLVTIMVSPPLANMAQLVLWLTVLGSGALRQRLWRALRQPMVRGALALYAVIAMATLYSPAATNVLLAEMTGWRRLLLVPVVVALFDEPRWKWRLLTWVVGGAVLFALLSYVGLLTGKSWGALAPGIIVRNTSTQGLLFAMAAFGAVVLFLNSATSRGRWIAGLSSAVLVLNAVAVTPSGSGYLALMVLSFLLALRWVREGEGAKRWLWSLALLGAVAASLATAPVSRERIQRAFHEAQHYDTTAGETSLGLRMNFWKNTVQLVQERPLLGIGTAGFSHAYRPYAEGRSGMAGVVTGDPHNQYLKFLAEQGAVGLLAFVAFLAAGFRQKPSPAFRFLGLGVMAAWCSTSLANAHYSTFVEGTFIYVWLAAMLANESRET